MNDDTQDSAGSPDVAAERAPALAALQEAGEAAPAVNSLAPAGASFQELVAASVGAEQCAATELADQLGLTRGPNVPYCDNSEENCRKLFEHFFQGRLWLDAFTQRILTTIDWKNPETPCPPRAWEGTDDINTTMYLQRQAGPKVRRSAVQDAVVAVAHTNRRNCVVDPALETRIAQEVRYVGRPWMEQVKETLVTLSQGKPLPPITAASLLNAMGLPVAQQNRSMATRVGVALRKLGASRKVRWVGGANGTPITEWTFPEGLPK